MISAGFPAPFLAMCATLKLRDPIDLLAVAANESGLNASAYNKGGQAAGLWQLTPVAAWKAGWNPGDKGSNMPAFAALTDVAQLPYWARYFRAHTGLLVSRAACYVSTYLPAGISLGSQPMALLCSANGRTDIPVPAESMRDPRFKDGWPKGWVISWYTGNLGFDSKKTGEIRVHQLEEAIDRSARALGAKWSQAVQMVRDAGAIEAAPPYIGPEYLSAPIHPAIEIPDNDPFDRLPK